MGFGATLAIALGMTAAVLALFGSVMIRMADTYDAAMGLDAEDREEQA